MLTCLKPTSIFAQIQFEEVTASSGIADGQDSFGASWGDFNGDGWPDLWVGNHCYEPALYINNGDGTFTDSTYLVDYSTGFEQHGAAWADFDNDGDQDLIQIVGGALENGNYRNQFFINSNGLLEDSASSYGLLYPLGRGRTPFWFDWNLDGYLDVFVTNLNRNQGWPASSALFTQQTNIFSNDTGLTMETDLGGESAQLFIPSFEGTPSLVIQAYYNTYPYRVYQYDYLPFLDITDTIGLPQVTDVRDVAIADFNNDLLNDFFLVTVLECTYPDSVEDRLFIQTEAGGFDDSTTAAGLDIPSSCWSVTSADFDNDMDIDLYLVCHGLNRHKILYENLGDGTFQEVTAAGGAEGTFWGYTVSSADYNNDGFIDLLVANPIENENASSYQLFRNIGNTNHWLEINIEGVASNRDGIGAILLATAGGTTQIRVQDGGIHRFSQDHKRIHFGLAGNTSVETLTVKWPNSIIQETYDVLADQIINIVELDLTGSLTTGAPPFQVDFTSNTMDYYLPLSYEWDFDNDGTIDSNLQDPSYTYNNNGTYTVKLKITNPDGTVITSTRTDYITVCNEEVSNAKILNDPTYYPTIQAAYDAAGEGDIIQSLAVEYTQNLNINRDISVAFEGGYNCVFTDIIGQTNLTGDITISNGTLTIENFTIE